LGHTPPGGFLPNVDGFDSQFFELSPRESIYVDPQHRLLLEVAWEGQEEAEQVRSKYEGSTGVFVGLWTSEYETRLYESGSEADFYSITGCGRASIAA
jgi:acyl transferase domain-containing protein